MSNLTKLIFFSLHVCAVPICISSFKILRFFFIFNLCSTREMERKAIPKAHHEKTVEKASLFSYPNFKMYLVTRFVLPHCAEFISFLCNKNYLRWMHGCSITNMHCMLCNPESEQLLSAYIKWNWCSIRIKISCSAVISSPKDIKNEI